MGVQTPTHKVFGRLGYIGWIKLVAIFSIVFFFFAMICILWVVFFRNNATLVSSNAEIQYWRFVM